MSVGVITPRHTTHSPQLSFMLQFKVWMTIVESGWNLWVWLAGGGCGYTTVHFHWNIILPISSLTWEVEKILLT